MRQGVPAPVLQPQPLQHDHQQGAAHHEIDEEDVDEEKDHQAEDEQPFRHWQRQRQITWDRGGGEKEIHGVQCQFWGWAAAVMAGPWG